MPKCARPHCTLQAADDSDLCGRHRWGMKRFAKSLKESLEPYGQKPHMRSLN